MSSRLLILCPGQGHQHERMFDLARSDVSGAALLDQLDMPVDPDQMFSNRLAQPLIVAATLALWLALRESAPRPALVAGYSVGELSAYGVAGALTAQETVALAATRAQLMDACVAAQPAQTLVAITGPSPQRCAQLIAAERYYVAIDISEESCIAGGPLATLESVQQKISAVGGRSSVLPVGLASHTPYLAPATAPFAAALRQAAFQPLQMPLLSGIAATTVHSPAMAVEQLSRQLAEPILWRGCMDACAEAGITVALELGPGNALARMLQARHPHIMCRAADDFRSLDGIRQWLERHCI